MASTSTDTLFRPPAPAPRRAPPDMFDFLAALRTNPLTTWTEDHFERLIVAGDGVLGRVTVVSDPAAIRHILVDNAANYRKDDLQRRVLAPGLGNGLSARLELAEGHAVAPVHRVTLRPGGGLPMKLALRR